MKRTVTEGFGLGRQKTEFFGLMQMENVSFTRVKVAVNVVLNFSIITTLFQYIFLCLH